MAIRISDFEHYQEQFPQAKRECAYKLALQIRQFEIELYWKRATYFWTLIAATFAGYFALATSKEPHPGLVFLVSCIGLVLSASVVSTN
jgi:lipopolysaccharide export LptBFGC system permease protein LptF